MTERSVLYIRRALSLLVILSMLLSPASLAAALSPQDAERAATGSPSPARLPGPAALVEAPTATATLTTTLTLTPSLTPTATPTPIVSATPPVTPTPAPSAALSLSKASAPDTVAPGEVVTFTLVLSNSGTAPARNLLLRDTLPQGLVYLPGSAPKAEYDSLAASLTWNLSGLEAGQAISRTLAARATVLPGETVTNTATLSGGDLAQPLTATASVYVGQADLIRPETGGSVRSADGRIELDFPPGAVQGLTEVSHRPLAPVDLPSGQ